MGGLTVGRVFEERHSGRIASRMNWLRAGVMGANDGIVSTAGGRRTWAARASSARWRAPSAAGSPPMVITYVIGLLIGTQL